MKAQQDFTFFSAIKFLSKYVKKYKLNFLLFYIGRFFDSILYVIMPIIFSIMIDEIVYYKNIQVFLKISGIFLIITLFSCILYFMIYTYHSYLMNMYTFDIKQDLFRVIQNAKASFLCNMSTGDVVNTILYDTQNCMHFIIRNIFNCGNTIIKCVLYGIYIFIISYKLGLIVLCLVPLSAYTSIKYGKRIRHYSNIDRDIYGHYISWLSEILKGLKDIRILSAQKKVLQKFTRYHNKIFKIKIKNSIQTIRSNKIVDFINLIIKLIIFVITAFMIRNGEITIGTFTVIIAYMEELINSMVYLNQYNLDLHMRLSSIQKINTLMNIETEDDWKGNSELCITKGKIEFRHVEFGYQDKNNVLSDLNLVIPAGCKLGLLGKSGCGKSTFIGLLEGLFECNSGEILIDDQNINSCTLKSIRNSIGTVQQDVLIFSGSIKENILIGNFKASNSDIITACIRADIYNFIISLPDGFDTIVGENGISLSGGQKQRIAIARIYLKNPKMIIFDEATSALDSKTEEDIINSWNELLKLHTSIIVSHRQSTIMKCDKVAIIDKGKIAAIGEPYKLLKDNPQFRELFAIDM